MIYVFSPAGRVMGTHPVPMSYPMSCAFGDADFSSLYVTTADGHLFKVPDSGLRG